MIVSGEVIAVAIAFDKHTPKLIRVGETLCRRLNKRLCLIHVVEPSLIIPPTPMLGGHEQVYGLIKDAEKITYRDACDHLEKLSKAVGNDVAVSTVVLEGRPSELLAKEATSRKALLLMTGISYRSIRRLPRGFSTAMSLMVSSPVPVMVLDTETMGDLSGDTLRLLVADDLSPASEPAVGFATSMAVGAAGAHLHQVHVSGLTQESLKSAVDSAMAASHTPIDSQVSIAGVYDAVMMQLNRRLEARREGGQGSPKDAKGKHTCEVVAGSVKQELDRVITEFKPDILVFGRHHAIHTQPFSIGRMPYKAMLTYMVPLIVVPGL